jgi:hypothetical protein
MAIRICQVWPTEQRQVINDRLVGGHGFLLVVATVPIWLRRRAVWRVWGRFVLGWTLGAGWRLSGS